MVTHSRTYMDSVIRNISANVYIVPIDVVSDVYYQEVNDSPGICGLKVRMDQ